MAAITVTLKQERETKNTMRFQEQVEDGQTPAIGQLYLQKSTYHQLGQPTVIVVTVAAE
ncbi:hypothetical protein [Methylacidiphilum caldifontis]|uniref:hypothetical protein n=1 Tax=Methylacidiphilum caldifontis TaxID=2795386 RepID=UPI00141B64CB|nr:hypothetical protein [Methylacidiphilum caldifontis]